MPYRVPDLLARLEPLSARDAEARWAQAIKRIAEIQRRLEQGATGDHTHGGTEDGKREWKPPTHCPRNPARRE